MRDLGAVLAEVGETTEAQHYTQVAGAFQPQFLQRSRKALFVPQHRVRAGCFVHQRTGARPYLRRSHRQLLEHIIGYTIGSGIFAPGANRRIGFPGTRNNTAAFSWNAALRRDVEYFLEHGIQLNPLYGTRYALDALRRDEAERALVCLIWNAGQGFTRGTFICGEGASLVPLDPNGRSFIAADSAANAHFLSMLRYLLVQDSDLDDDGKPETRPRIATPRRWLEDGKGYEVQRAPTVRNALLENVLPFEPGRGDGRGKLARRNTPQKTLLRARVPDGWRVISAQAARNHCQQTRKAPSIFPRLRGARRSIRCRTEMS